MQARWDKIEDAIVGVWTFGSYVTADVDGSDPRHPLGEEATGTIMYTRSGYMSVQISAKDRQPYTDGALHGGTDAERAAAAAGYLAYTGTYTVDGDVVIHRPFASLFPNWEGADIPRRATIADDVLTLDLLEPIQQGGRERTGTLRWEHAAAL